MLACLLDLTLHCAQEEEKKTEKQEADKKDLEAAKDTSKDPDVIAHKDDTTVRTSEM